VDKATEEYFRDFNELFRSPGWERFREELAATVVELNNIATTKDEQDLFFRKGQLAVLGNILNMEQQVEAAYADANGSAV
jgi:hypothetical protein